MVYHAIWDLELYVRKDKFNAECTVCKANDPVSGELVNKPLKLAKQSICGLITHLPRRPEYEAKFEELVGAADTAKAQPKQGAMDKHVYPMGRFLTGRIET